MYIKKVVACSLETSLSDSLRFPICEIDGALLLALVDVF